MAPKYLKKLERRSVVIVGGTSGIGFCVAEACVEYGASVVVASRSQEKVNRAVTRLKASYPDHVERIRGHVCDLSADDIETSVSNLLDFASNGGKDPLDHVVNTAADGDLPSVMLDDANTENILSMQRTRFLGALLLAKSVAKYVRQAPTSSLTLTGGVAMYRPRKGATIRSAAGGSVEVITRALAVDLAPIRVNMVSPGATETEMMAAFAARMGGEDAARAAFRGMSILGVVGLPEDVAESYLCSIRNNFVTGSVLHTEGGYLLK